MTDSYRDESEKEATDSVKPKILNSVATADMHLQEVEQTLWAVSRQTDSPELVEAVDELLTVIWELQHSLEDIQDEIDSHSDPEDEHSSNSSFKE